MVVPKFSIANPSFEMTPTNPYMNIPNNKRPPETAINIQQGRMPTQSNTVAPCSLSCSLMDSFPPSKENYAERIASISNKMDFEMSNHEMEGLYSLSPSNNSVQNKAVSNTTLQPVPSIIPITPSAIPYEANASADPNLWDGHFGLIFFFGTNKFLQSNAHNISCSLICIAQFIRQRNIADHDSNKIPQIDSVGEVAYNFITAPHEAGWDKLNTVDKTSLRNKVQLPFANHNLANQNTARNLIKNISPCIPIRLPPKQVEEVRKRMEQRKNKKNQVPKSYAQASSPAANVLKLKDAFLALPNKKIIEIHNASLNKSNTPLKTPLGSKLLFLSSVNT